MNHGLHASTSETQDSTRLLKLSHIPLSLFIYIFKTSFLSQFLLTNGSHFLPKDLLISLVLSLCSSSSLLVQLALKEPPIMKVKKILLLEIHILPLLKMYNLISFFKCFFPSLISKNYSPHFS